MEFENVSPIWVGLQEIEIIKLMAEKARTKSFKRFGIDFKDLWGRSMQLIDCQNVFCEIGKYARVKFPDVKDGSGRVRIKQTFKPKGERLQFWYPPKWGINEKVKNDYMKLAIKGDQYEF